MSYWLYEHITRHDESRKPSFSVQATHNWFKALKFEVENTHGKTCGEQVESCRRFYRSTQQQKNISPNEDVFEHLFFSVIYAMTLDRFANTLNDIPWIRPTAIVDWYYATYFSIRAMFSVLGNSVPEDHSKTAKFVASTFRTHLPHPFNMIARRTEGEDYGIFLMEKNPEFYDLSRAFFNTSLVAQGMLTQYLKGTADWYAKRTKNNILIDSKGKFSNFRSKEAQKIRDKRLATEIGFLHCAFRQRVKANYRDAIYLSYDYGEEINLDSLVKNLSVSAKFSSITAMAYLEHHLGTQIMQSFFNDLSQNLRGVNFSSDSERYWRVFS